MRNLMSDVRFALRGLVNRPAFTLVVVLTLGLGIGVNTSIFSLFNQVALRPLPVAEPDRLVNLTSPGPRPGSTSNNRAGSRESIFSYPMYRDLNAVDGPFQGIAAHRVLNSNLAAAGRTTSGRALLVSGNYFSLLGLSPALGRLIDETDDAAAGAGRVAVLSHSYWKNSLGGLADVINQSIVVNGQSLAVIGVAPPGFGGTTFGQEAQVFVPITLRGLLQSGRPADLDNRLSYWVYLFARLQPGVTTELAQQTINVPFERLINEVEAPMLGEHGATDMEQFRQSRIQLQSGARGQSTIADNAGLPLSLMLAASGLVLLVACLNIANLMLARGASRASEFAVRASIGASRQRMLRQMLVEAGVLASLGALVSLPMAIAVAKLLVAGIPMSGSESFSAALDARALGFSLLVAGGSVLVFGLFPAWHLARTQPIAALRGDSGSTGRGRAATRFRSALATVQIALSMVSLVLAGLFAQSLLNLSRVDYGMQIDSIATFSISPARNGYSAERSAQLYSQLERSLAHLPGVTSVTTSLVPLLDESAWGSNITVEGFEPGDDEEASSLYNEVGEGYFRTLGIPLLAGRGFGPGDGAGGAGVAIVNRAFAEQYGLGSNPIGKRMVMGDDLSAGLQIVGLVEDSLYDDPRGIAPALFYLPRSQDSSHGEMTFYVSSAMAPASMLRQLAETVAGFDPDLPLEHLETLNQRVDATLAVENFVGVLAIAFALLSTLLASIGLYGVMSYTLSQRVRELGLRLALGAAPAQLYAMLMRQVGSLALIGAVLGIVAAVMMSRVARSLLFGLDGQEPIAFVAAAVLLAAVALASGWLPARRAAGIDPMTALRQD